MIKKTITALILTVAMVFSFSASAFAADGTKASTQSYRTVTEVEDWGACVTKVIVNLGEGRTVSKDSVAADTFKAHVEKYQQDGKTKVQIHDPSDPTWQHPERKVELPGGDRTITKAYVSDKDGNPVASSNFVTLELEIGPNEYPSPNDYLGSAIYATGDFSSGWVIPKYTIEQQKDIYITTGAGVTVTTGAGTTITNSTEGVRKLVDDFGTGSFTNAEDNITLTFADYTPVKDNKKNPLIIWLHGMGEGGTDPTIPISGNKAANFASKEIQSYFDGAYVLAPQTPTYWMQSTTRPIGDGIGGDYFGDGSSKDEKALMALIKDYVSNHSDIDTNRIYIGGDSNGGYMTMVMARDYGSYFAAAMPTCEALKDSMITDADIQKMKDVPIWFTAAKTDPLVGVDKYINPTYDRLVKAGAKNVHKSLFDKVLDATGLYKKSDGTPYEYFGHSSWIYVYNNECKDTVNGKTMTIMEWLADQTLATTTSSSSHHHSDSSSTSSAGNNSSTADSDKSTTGNQAADNKGTQAPAGWQKQSDNTWKLSKEDGQIATGWNQINGTWYLMDSTGTMKVGWQQTNGTWYLLKNDGAMATGWQQANGIWYYLYADGSMASNAIIDGYAVDESGAWIN